MKFIKASLVVAFAMLSGLVAPFAKADTEVFTAYPDSSVMFDYEKATISEPLIVNASTADKSCKFTVSLVGLQKGAGLHGGGTLTGRVDKGTCGTASMTMDWSVAAVHSTSKNGKSLLDQTAEMFVVTVKKPVR